MVRAKKHDGTYRTCIDYRKRYQLTKKGAISLPWTDDVLEGFGEALTWIWPPVTGRCK